PACVRGVEGVGMSGVLASGRRRTVERLRPGRPRGRAVRREDARGRARPPQPPPPWGASSRLSCPCWRDSHRDLGHPALPCGGRGRMTEQGMAQGQPGRPPPGHAWRAPRPFVRDAVVFEDYTIAEGRVIPQGAPRTRYHPETCPALPQQLARLARGDTSAVLAFVRTYGLLGYASLAAAVGRGVPSDAAGDPLGWIWAQAETVALCLHLTYGLQAGDEAALQHSLRA